MKNILSTIMLLCVGAAFAQGTHKFEDPLMFVDSVQIYRPAMESIKPDDVASINVYKDSTALAMYGDKGKNGVIYIETKAFSKQRVWNVLSAKSADYKRVFPTAEIDGEAVYIYNGSVLSDDDKGKLSTLTAGNLKSVTVINRKKLKKEYKISDKEYGVVIEVIEPKQ